MNQTIETCRGEAAPRPSRATEMVAPTVWRAFVRTLRGATLVAMLTLITAAPGHADVWYSGAAVAPNGAVLGWGVTDVTNYSMFHLAWATTTLTSPVKHRQASYTTGAQNWTRTDVSLPFDSGDLGTYSVSSTHTGWCSWCNCYAVSIALKTTYGKLIGYGDVGSTRFCEMQPDCSNGLNCSGGQKPACGCPSWSHVITTSQPCPQYIRGTWLAVRFSPSQPYTCFIGAGFVATGPGPCDQ